MKLKPWIFYALLTLCLWSTLAYLSTLLTEVPPFLLLGITLLIGALPSVHRIGTWFERRSVIALGVAGIFGYHLFFFMALRLAPPVEANLLNYLWPILIVLFTPLFFKQYQLKWTHYLGAHISFAGAGLCVTGGQLSLSFGNAQGYCLAILAALVWSLYSVATKKVKPFPTSAVGGFCFIAALLAWAIHFSFEPAVSLSSTQWTAMIAMGSGPLGIAFYTWDKAMKEGDPRIVGGLAYFEPLLSSFVLIFLGHKTVSPSFYIAVLLVIAGAAISSIEVPARFKKANFLTLKA